MGLADKIVENKTEVSKKIEAEKFAEQRELEYERKEKRAEIRDHAPTQRYRHRRNRHWK